MKVVIDGDVLPYSCGFAAKGEPLSHVLKLIKNKLEQIIKDTKADEYELYIAGEGNFRDDIAVTDMYKGNRTAPRPPTYEASRDYMVNVWGAKKVDGMEVDDKVSYLLYKDFLKGGKDVILSSNDKDLKNTPGLHYNPRTRDIDWISDNQALRHFCFQMLCGDSVDNIKGLPHCAASTYTKYGLTKASLKGCGKVSAKKIMYTSSTWEEALEDVFVAYLHCGEEAHLSEDQTKEYILEQGQLLWMTREMELDQPKLFTIDEIIYARAIDRYRAERVTGYDTSSGY